MTFRQALATWLAGACLVLGCSWFVDPLEAHPRCNPDAGNEVCPKGLTCQEGRCERFCTPDGSEICADNVDNDCDGKVDEEDALGREACGDHEDNDCDGEIDEDSDRDLDGVNYCGNWRTLADGGSEFEKADCDDGRREVSPKQVEVCDNLDNDCNNLTDDAPPGKSLCPADLACFDGRCIKPSCALPNERWACPSGEVCSPETGRCEAVAVGCASVVCSATQECDPVTTKCRERPKRSNGVACLVDDDCISGTCIDAAALRLASGLRICGQACCGDASCGEGERCFASGTGARSCLPIAMLPVTARKQCTTDMSCGADQRCGLENDQRLSSPNYTPLIELTTSVCRPEPTGRKLGEGCSLPSPTTCSSHTCVTAPYAGFICSTPCGRSEDCKAFGETAPFRWYPGSPPGKSYCRYLSVHPREGDKTDYASLCVVRRIGETGEGDWGDECSTAQDCRDRGCVGAIGTTRKGRCLIACCDNSQCGPNENGRLGTCRPFAIGMGYEMRCETPTPPP